MCAGSNDRDGFARVLRDPLIRLVMESDGVTEQAMINLLHHLRRSLVARDQAISAHARRPVLLNALLSEKEPHVHRGGHRCRGHGNSVGQRGRDR